MKLEQKRVKFFNLTHLFYIILVCLCVLLSSSAFAENRVEAERQNWDVFTHRGNVDALLLSDDGKILWAGTRGGLEKRDAHTGELIKVFTNLDGLPDNFIVSLLSDGKGGVWVGTYGGGLGHLKSNGTWEVYRTSSSELPHDWIFDLLSDGQGGIWIGTGAGGLAHLKSDNSWEILNKDNSELPDNYVYALSSDGSGGLWVGTYGSGLAHFKSNETWEIFNNTNSQLPGNTIQTLLSDGSGGVWIGTGESEGGVWIIGTGLAHFKSDETWEIFNKSNSQLPHNSVYSLLSDVDSGDLLVGTSQGLARLKSDKTWKVFNSEYSNLQDISINSLLYDGKGGAWIGTYEGGITHLKSDDSLEIFTDGKKGLSDNYIETLLRDGYGGLWVGTFNGLLHFKSDDTWEVFNKQNSALPRNYIETLFSDNNGGLWIGTYGAGLAHFKSDGAWEIFNKTNSELPSNYVQSILSDKSGGLWIGMDQGNIANLKSDGIFELFDSDSGLPDDLFEIISLSNMGFRWKSAYILSDNNSGMWLGIYYKGIIHIKSDETSEEFTTKNSGLPDKNVKSLIPDGNGGIWIETDGGLARLKSDGGWEIFTIFNSGLPYNYVSSVLSDGLGGLWIGTGNILGYTGAGLAHLMLLGTPDQIINPNSPEIIIDWFLNSSSLDYQNVKYIELQRSLSKDGVYETVLDGSDKPVRFYADYSICPKPRVDGCWVTVEGHTPETRTNSDGSTTKGYTLNTPINDPEWLEGLPRYYRLSAVIEEDGKLVRVANNSEAALITPQVEEKPRVELTLDRNAIAMKPNTKAEITVFATSLDLFRGDVELEIESATGNTISNNINVELEPAAISLKSGETKPVLLTIDAFAENTQTIKIIPKIQSGYSGKSTSLNVQVGDDTTPMIALSIAHKTKRTRVLDSLTISGNVIPAQAGQSVVISGNNIKESAESATFTTDENGYFQGSVTPIHAGLLTLTAKSNGITSNNAEIFILPAKTNIALSSNVNQSTKKGDILRVQGIITPIRLDGTKVNLDIRYLDPANQDAGLQPQFVGGVEIDANGVFYRDVVAPGNGFINVKASLPETSDYLSINTKLVIPIGQPVGEGIIVVSESGNGTSSDSGNSGLSDSEFQNISKTLGQYVYNALRSRNIPAERIKYLGLGGDKIIADSNINANLATENFAKVSKSNLHDALTNWAATLFSTDDPYKTPLNLYLIGKVEDGSFRLNDNEVLTADALVQYLNEAEEIIKTNSKDNYSEYKGFPVTIVLEGTQSGKWIKKISGNGRIILTSSSDEAVDAGGFAGYDNLGESSFSRYFYEFINYGSDIEGSFAEANYEILKFYHHTQRPLMDADGDGIATRNEWGEASGKFIEYRPSGNLRPQIITTNPHLTINRGDAQNNFLWAIATDPENEMQGVFCSITDPSNLTVNIELKHEVDNRYLIEFNQYLVNGCYQLVYYAKDKAGNVSLPEQKLLNVITSSGVLPQAPQIKITTKGNMVTVSWSEVQGAEGYKLFYAPYPNPEPSDIGEIDMGNQRTITFDGKGFAFYGAVKAYNKKRLSELSNIEYFDLR